MKVIVIENAGNLKKMLKKFENLNEIAEKSSQDIRQNF